MKHKIISAVILLALEAIIISLALWAGEHFDIPTNILIELAKYHKTTTDYILGLSDKR